MSKRDEGAPGAGQWQSWEEIQALPAGANALRERIITGQLRELEAKYGQGEGSAIALLGVPMVARREIAFLLRVVDHASRAIAGLMQRQQAMEGELRSAREQVAHYEATRSIVVPTEAEARAFLAARRAGLVR